MTGDKFLYGVSQIQWGFQLHAGKSKLTDTPSLPKTQSDPQHPAASPFPEPEDLCRHTDPRHPVCIPTGHGPAKSKAGFLASSLVQALRLVGKFHRTDEHGFARQLPEKPGERGEGSVLRFVLEEAHHRGANCC